VGQPEGFDSYFRFAPPSDQITIEKLQDVSANFHNEPYLEEFLRDAMGRRDPDGKSLAAPFLEALPAILDRRDHVEPALLAVLLRVGDEIVGLRDEQADFYLMTNRMRLGTVLRILIKLIDGSALYTVVMAALDQDKFAIGTTAILIGRLAAEHGFGPFETRTSEEPPRLARAQVEHIAHKFATRAAAQAVRDELPDTPLMDAVLAVWSAFRETEVIRAWIARRPPGPSLLCESCFLTNE